jgi:1-phosphofructokinase family hexose kinase
VIVCVAANPSIDKLFEVERLSVGAIHRPLSFVQVAGGKGLNVARAAHALGAEVTATGILAGHAGRWIDETLHDDGVDAVFTWVGGETRASLSVAARRGIGLTEFYEAGPDVGEQGWRDLEKLVEELLRRAAWVTISGNVPPGSPIVGYARIVRAAHDAGVPVALDARDEALELAVAEGPDVVKVNAEEAGTLLGVSIASASAARDAAVAIRGSLRIGGSAVVTRGAEGAAVALPDGRVLWGRPSAEGAYPVGSGDAFLAGLVTGLERGEGWEEATRLAFGAAAANAEVPGAGRLDPVRARTLASVSELSLVPAT